MTHPPGAAYPARRGLKGALTGADTPLGEGVSPALPGGGFDVSAPRVSRASLAVGLDFAIFGVGLLVAGFGTALLIGDVRRSREQVSSSGEQRNG